MRPREVEVLLLANKLDFPTDRVCDQLRQLGTEFLRCNFDDMDKFRFVLEPVSARLECKFEDTIWFVGDSLKSVWWRQPTFYRGTKIYNPTPTEQLYRSQWAAFMRSLIVFENAQWFNHPATTYQAEVKAYQLQQAHVCGFSVPKTLITNDDKAKVPTTIGNPFALKSIDTILLRESESQHFGYTSITDWTECLDGSFNQVPATCQQFLNPKIDLRVTVLDDKLWCDEIVIDAAGIQGDWRLKKKDDLEYKDFSLPADIAQNCLNLVKSLGLQYGAIDLALSDGIFWFIEINPTGEWGWLDRPGRGISQSIAKKLSQ